MPVAIKRVQKETFHYFSTTTRTHLHRVVVIVVVVIIVVVNTMVLVVEGAGRWATTTKCGMLVVGVGMLVVGTARVT